MALVALVAVAVADDISNNLDTSIDAVAETMNLTPGGANGTTQLAVTPRNLDGKNGCNLTGSTTLVVSVASSDTGVATVSPSSVTFSSCGDTPTLTVTPVAQGTATVSLSQTSNNTGASFDLDPAKFTVNVAGPANNGPSVTVTGVTDGASYDKGSVPDATCEVTDEEDGASSFAATLSAVTGPHAADGIGSQTASCSYTDDGGLTDTDSATYSIGDPTAPDIHVDVTPDAPNGESGWYTSDVTVTWTVTESDSPNSLTKTDCVDQNITADQVATTYSCSASSAGGSAAPVSVTIKRDATGPVITLRDAGDSCDTPGDNGWCRGTQTAGFEAMDATSGLLGHDSPYEFTQSTTTNGSAVKISSGTLEDNAGNDATAIDAGPYKIDSASPTISGSASPAANTTGWNNEDVTVSFTCDDAGGSGVASCTPDQTLTGEGRDQSATGNVTDKAGNTASDTVSNINIDKTGPSAPTASPDREPDDLTGGWFKDTVTVSYAGSTDPKLGDPVTGQDGSDVAGYTAPQTFNASGAHNYSGKARDNADNESSATTGTVKVDATNPTVSITGCPSGPVVTGSAVNVTVAAADAHSGLVTDPSGTVALDTSSIGSKMLTRTVADNVAHGASASCSYSVIYDWDGFFRPIDNLPIVNTVKAGSSVPVKFSLGGNQGLAIFAPYHPASVDMVCQSTADFDAVEETSTAGQSTLSYDPLTDQYNYVWKTDKAWAGRCRQLVVKLADNTYHRANFKFMK